MTENERNEEELLLDFCLQPAHEKDMNNDVFPLNVIMGQTGWVQQGDLRSVRQNTGCVRVMAAVTQQNCHDWMIS